MGNLGGDLEKRLAKLGIKKQVEASLIVEEAQKKIEDIFGDKGKENLRAVSVKNGVLKIAASNNLWAAECQGKVSCFINGKIKKVTFIIEQVY